MSQEKVIVISHGFQSHYELGFVNGLAANGIDVTLLGSDNTLRDQLHAGVVFIGLRGSQDEGRSRLRKALNLMRYHLSLIAFIAQHRQATVHVIGVFWSPILEGLLENLLIRALSRRLVLTVHNLLPHGRHDYAIRSIYRLAYLVPTALVVHTQRMKSDLVANFGIPAGKIWVMQHGLNDQYLSASGSGEELRAAVSGGNPAATVFLLFGVVAPYKGADILLNALGRLGPEASVIIAGQVPSAQYLGQLKAMIANSSSRDRILLHNRFIAHEQLPDYFSAADALVMPYRHIDQSGVLFLGMSFGIPVIASNVGSLAEYLDDKSGMIVDDLTEERLSAAMRRFCADKRRYSRVTIREQARRFLWSNTVREILKLYA